MSVPGYTALRPLIYVFIIDHLVQELFGMDSVSISEGMTFGGGPLPKNGNFEVNRYALNRLSSKPRGFHFPLIALVACAI